MADFVLRRLIHHAMGGQRDHINRHPASTFAQALGHQLGQEGIVVAFERIQVAALAGQVPQQAGPEGAPSNWLQAWYPASPAAAAKTTHSRSRLAWRQHRQGPGAEGSRSPLFFFALYSHCAMFNYRVCANTSG